MELSDRERRRLDAEAFDILEYQDGFRLQLLLEFRNRAARSRLLLIDELVRASLIDPNRYRLIQKELGLEQGRGESVVIDHTLGEESYEDSVVDVAPLPGGSELSPAPIGNRQTLTQGSLYRSNAQPMSSMGSSEQSRSGSDLSDLEMSSITMRPMDEELEPASALLGAPQQRQFTQPDVRIINAHESSSDSRLDKLQANRLFGQTECLLELKSDDSNALRVGLAAHNFAHLSFNASRLSYTDEHKHRFRYLCDLVTSRIEPNHMERWMHSFLSSMRDLADGRGQLTEASGYTGALVIRGGSGEGELLFERLDITKQTIEKTPVSIELASDEPRTADTCAGTIVLPQGWYQITYSQGRLKTTLQQFVIGDYTSTLLLPSKITDQNEFTLIHGGPALLGEVIQGKQYLNFDVYTLAPFLLAPKRVSHRDYFEFLSFISKTQGPQAATRRSPRSAPRGSYKWKGLDFSQSEPVSEALGDLATRPVTGISFHDARAYCHWLNIESGPGHRLPTEVEWEKAVRGALGTQWSWGDDWASRLNLSRPSGSIVDGVSGGMEWTSSSGEDARYRVTRGLSSDENTLQKTLAERVFLPEEQVSSTVGFRVAKAYDH